NAVFTALPTWPVASFFPALISLPPREATLHALPATPLRMPTAPQIEAEAVAGVVALRQPAAASAASSADVFWAAAFTAPWSRGARRSSPAPERSRPRAPRHRRS